MLLEPGYLRSALQRHFGRFSSTRDHTITKPFQSSYIVNTEIFKAWKQLKITLLKHSTDYMYSRALELTSNMKYQNRLLLFLSPSLQFSLSITNTHTHTHTHTHAHILFSVKTIVWKTGNIFLNNISISNKTVLHVFKTKTHKLCLGLYNLILLNNAIIYFFVFNGVFNFEILDSDLLKVEITGFFWPPTFRFGVWWFRIRSVHSNGCYFHQSWLKGFQWYLNKTFVSGGNPSSCLGFLNIWWHWVFCSLFSLQVKNCSWHLGHWWKLYFQCRL